VLVDALEGLGGVKRGGEARLDDVVGALAEELG
jgi:hypothetical protein